jgi:hypothetical protein
MTKRQEGSKNFLISYGETTIYNEKNYFPAKIAIGKGRYRSKNISIIKRTKMNIRKDSLWDYSAKGESLTQQKKLPVLTHFA